MNTDAEASAAGRLLRTRRLGLSSNALRDIGYDLAATSWAAPSIFAYTHDEWQHRKERGFPFQRAVERDAVSVL